MSVGTAVFVNEPGPITGGPSGPSDLDRLVGGVPGQASASADYVTSAIGRTNPMESA